MKHIQDLLQIFYQEKFVAVVRENSYEKAIEVIDAIIEGGVKIIEITLTTPDAIKLIKHYIHNEKLVVGAGTVCSLQDLELVVNAGAKFVVAPHFDQTILEKSPVLYIPGFFSPNEGITAYNALKNKYQCNNFFMKLFPANILNINYVKDLLKPYPHFNLMPSGGVSYDNLDEWFEAKIAVASVGSALSKNKNYAEIVINVKKYLNKVEKWKTKF